MSFSLSVGLSVCLHVSILKYSNCLFDVSSTYNHDNYFVFACILYVMKAPRKIGAKQKWLLSLNTYSLARNTPRLYMYLQSPEIISTNTSTYAMTVSKKPIMFVL